MTQELFTHIEGAVGVLYVNGLYKPVKLYAYEGRLFAAYRGGFIRLKPQEMTSIRGVSCGYINNVEYHETYNGLMLGPKPAEVVVEQPVKKRKLKAA